MKNLLDTLDVRNIKSPALQLVAAPIIGGLFVVFMPLMGFLAVGEAIYKKLVEYVKD